MNSDNTIVFIIAAVIVAHFIFGIGYLMYKMQAPAKKKQDKETDVNDP
jgi:hypothetical protein